MVLWLFLMILELSRRCDIVVSFMILELFRKCGIVASFMILELSRKCGIVVSFMILELQVWYCGFFHDFRTVPQV